MMIYPSKLKAMSYSPNLIVTSVKSIRKFWTLHNVERMEPLKENMVTMNIRIISFSLAMLLSYVMQAQQSTALRLLPFLDCENEQLSVELQIKAKAGQDFNIGTSSIYMKYNSKAIHFTSYKSQNFDENSKCINGVASSWDKQVFDAYSRPGHFNLTLMLNQEGYGCPAINDQEWVSIGTAQFEILDKSLSPKIFFDLANTHFNEHSLNNGTKTINKERLWGLREKILDCDVAPKLSIENLGISRKDAQIDISWTYGQVPMGSMLSLERAWESGNFSLVKEFDVNPELSGKEFIYNDELKSSEISPVLKYRFKLLQVDGTHSYSEVMELTLLEVGKLGISILPNPATEQFFIDYMLPKAGMYSLEIIDLAGRSVYSSFEKSVFPWGRIEVSSREWVPGMYIVKLDYDGTVDTTKVLLK